MQDYAQIMDHLRTRGYRLTTARASVVRALCSADTFLGAYDIYHGLKAGDTKVSVASIYRVLSLLWELGLVRKEEFGAGGEKFRLLQAGHTHQLICSGCGIAKEFANCGIAGLATKLEGASGYKIHDHWLKFFGLCPKCQDNPTD